MAAWKSVGSEHLHCPERQVRRANRFIHEIDVAEQMREVLGGLLRNVVRSNSLHELRFGVGRGLAVIDIRFEPNGLQCQRTQ